MSVLDIAYQEPQCYEMHDGRVVAMASGTANHGIIGANITAIFTNFLKGKPCRVWNGSIDVHLTDKDYFVPDVAVVCNPDIISDDGIYGAPDLVVEILSPSTARRDRGYKKNLYEKRGVKEYWIITIEARSIEVYLLQDGKLALDDVYSVLPEKKMQRMSEQERSDIVSIFSPSTFPGLTVMLDEIFANLI